VNATWAKSPSWSDCLQKWDCNPFDHRNKRNSQKRGPPAILKSCDRAESKASFFEFIEVQYNRQRRHSHNGQVAPLAFEAMTDVECPE